MNKLSKRLNQLKREKQNLANEVEQEEEYLVNNLQKRLSKVLLYSTLPRALLLTPQPHPQQSLLSGLGAAPRMPSALYSFQPNVRPMIASRSIWRRRSSSGASRWAPHSRTRPNALSLARRVLGPRAGPALCPQPECLDLAER